MGSRYANSCPDPVKVEALQDWRVKVLFEDSCFPIVTDMKPMLDFPIFAELKKPNVFYHPRITSDGAISWGEGLDFAPEYFYRS